MMKYEELLNELKENKEKYKENVQKLITKWEKEAEETKNEKRCNCKM